tara:strand:- start:2128 stop:2394 length:267 start_codon:yes stop_codon:yes gene_type:complete
MRFIKCILAVPQIVKTLNDIYVQFTVVTKAITSMENRIKIIEHDLKNVIKDYSSNKSYKSLEERVSVIEAFFDNLEEIATEDKKNVAN